MSPILAIKLRRDLRAVWPRLLMMTVAITMSLIVFGGVLYAWTVVGRETGDAYTGTEPASATLVLDEPFDADRMAAIAEAALERPGIISATARTQFNSDIAINGTPSATPLQIFAAAPDDPMDLARFQVEDAAWPPAADEIYIGRDSLDLLDVAAGDTVTVTTPGGEPVELRVAGTVYDPSLAPATQEQTGHAYLSPTALGDAAGFDQLKIQVAEAGESEPTRDRDTVVAEAGELSDWLQTEYGLTVGEIQAPEPYAHPHQGQSDALLLALLAGGAAALLLSAVLVANMLNGLFTQQIPQIGILKAIGARSGRIGRFYSAMVLLVAALATLVALAPAVVLGRAGSAFVLGFLGIEARDPAAPWWVYAVILAAGLLLPPAMALVPLVKASRTTVREAMDHHGLSTRPSAASSVVARMSRIRFLDRGLLMALRNTMRRPARFALAAGLLASAGTVFVAGMSLSAGTEAIDAERREQRTWDVEVHLAGSAPVAEVAALAQDIDGIEGIEGWNKVPAGVAEVGAVPVSRTYPDQGHGRVSVVAVPAGTAMLPEPELLEGRWLAAEESGAVVLNQNARDSTVPDIAVGDPVQLFIGGEPTEWTVVGIVQERQGGSGAYVTDAGFADATGKPLQANQFRVAIDGSDEADREAAAAALETALTDAGFAVNSAASVSRSDAISSSHLGPVITILLGIAIVMGVVGGIGLASTMSANVLDRTRELGVMHALGAQPKAVRRVVVAEGVFLALTSCVVAIVPTLILTAAMGSGIGNLFMSAPLPFRVSWIAVGVWLALVVIGGALASEAAASRASRITVREALAYL